MISLFTFAILFPDDSCSPALSIHSNSRSLGAKFNISSVLTNECDFLTETHSNYFLTPNNVKNGYITMDLGCSACVNRVILKNTPHAHLNK